MKRILILLFCVFLLPLPLYSVINSEDLVYLYEFLEENHPSFYNSIDESEARAILEEEIAEAEKKQEDESSFFFSLQHIASIPHDSHTSMALTYELFLSEHVFPIVFDFFSDELVVVAIESYSSSFLSKTVDSINGVSVEEIISKACEMIPHDNDVHLKLELKNNYLSFAEFYAAIGIDSDDMRISFSDGTTLTLDKMSYSLFSSIDFAYLRNGYPDTLGMKNYYSAYKLPDSDALLINYHLCAEIPDYPFRDFALDVSHLIDEYEYGKIVIDLRYNSGGNSEVINPLVEVLKEKDVEVFVLIDEGTFSSAVLNALMLKNELDAIFVGRPTGGSASHYGEILSGTLPDSGLGFTYSTKFFDCGISGPLMPDILIEKDIDDYINGVDTDLKALGFLDVC